MVTRRIAWLALEKGVKTDEILALTFTEKAAGEMEERLDKLLPYGYVDLWVSTFHAFCQRILEAHALDIGLPNDFRLLDSTGQWMLVRENMDRFELDYYKPLGNPTKFIHAMLGHFSRAKDEGISPEEYLEYAEEVKLNLDVGEALGGKMQGYKKQDANKIQITNNKFQTQPSHKASADTTNSKFEIRNSIISDTVGVEDLQSRVGEAARLGEIANAYHQYQQLLLENDMLDFGDLIVYTLKLFKQRPELLKKYQEQFKYILVDEFQDTNWAQFELVRQLAAPDNNLTVVADDDQSIYRWRGASYSNVLQFKDYYPDTTEVSLVNNYRSAQEILDFSYQFIQGNNPERLEEKIPSLSKKLVSQVAGGATIGHLHAADEQGEVEVVEQHILDTRKKEQCDWNSFAVLVRSNAQATAFMAGFERAGVPYHFLSSRGLYTKSVILDTIAYFKLLDNYHESPAVYRVLAMPHWGLGDATLVELSHTATKKTWSLYEAMKQVRTLKTIREEDVVVIENIVSLIEKHTTLARSGSAAEVLLGWIEESGLGARLEKEETLEASRDADYLQQLYKKVQDFEQSFADTSLRHFLTLFELELDSGEMGSLSSEVDAGPDMVKILTVHASKGLEFPYVFVVNMVDKRFPTIRRSDPIAMPDPLVKEILPEGDWHLQEERRLLYVAMTRAQRGLYLTSAENYGGKTKKKLSRFLTELSEQGFALQEEAHVASSPLVRKGTKAVTQQDHKTPYQPTAFSFTQLSDFKKCPYQYWLKYILKLPRRGAAALSYGQTMHTTLKRFFDRLAEQGDGRQGDLFGGGQTVEPSLPSKEELLKMYEEAWIDDWYDSHAQKEQYRKQGRESLKSYHDILSAREALPVIRGLEKRFSFKILGSDESVYSLRGSVDRMDVVEGGIAIVDYKTGKPKEKLTKQDKQQLLMYQIAAAEVFGETPVELVYYYLNNNTAVSFLGSDKEIAGVKQDIVDTIEAIRGYFFPPSREEHSCSYCKMRELDS